MECSRACKRHLAHYLCPWLTHQRQVVASVQVMCVASSPCGHNIRHTSQFSSLVGAVGSCRQLWGSPWSVRWGCLGLGRAVDAPPVIVPPRYTVMPAMWVAHVPRTCTFKASVHASRVLCTASSAQGGSNTRVLCPLGGFGPPGPLGWCVVCTRITPLCACAEG